MNFRQEYLHLSQSSQSPALGLPDEYICFTTGSWQNEPSQNDGLSTIALNLGSFVSLDHPRVCTPGGDSCADVISGGVKVSARLVFRLVIWMIE